MVETQTVLSGPSVAMDRKKQCGSVCGLHPGGSNTQDLVCPHPWEENCEENIQKKVN